MSSYAEQWKEALAGYKAAPVVDREEPSDAPQAQDKAQPLTIPTPQELKALRVEQGLPAEPEPSKRSPDPVKVVKEAQEGGTIVVRLDQHGAPYIAARQTRPDGRVVKRVLPLGSRDCDDFLQGLIREKTGRPASKSSLEVVSATLRLDAKDAGVVEPVYLRQATLTDSRVVRDHGPGMVVEIDVHGYRVVDESGTDAPSFYRSGLAAPLPEPERVTDPKAACSALLKHFTGPMRLGKRETLIIIALILTWMQGTRANPILQIYGPADSGKSTFAYDGVLALLDPIRGNRPAVGATVEDFAAVAQHLAVIVLENIGSVDSKMANTLCMAATGATQMVRSLYFKNEVTPLTLSRPVITTSLSPVCTAADLQTRAFSLELRPFNGQAKATDEGVTEIIERERPALLGAFYCLLSAVLRDMPAVVERGGFKHRMVGFEATGEAMFAALGRAPGEFSRVLARARLEQEATTASGDSFVIALKAALTRMRDAGPTDKSAPTLSAMKTRKPAFATWFEADGSLHVLARIGALMPKMPLHLGEGGRAVPFTERALGGALRRVQPLLHSVGITYREVKLGSRRFVEMSAMPEVWGDDA